MGTTQSVRTLDPADSYELFPGILLFNLGDRLYTYKPGTTELVPQLATDMPQISEDNLTYVIPLREDVVFHDGEPFNAEAMAFSLNRFIENGGRPAFLLAEKVESVEATSDYELTIKLRAPFAAFPSLLSFWGMTAISPKAYTIGAGDFEPTSFVGTGPYQLAELSSDTVRLDANPDYWGEQPANEGVDIQLISSPANLYNTFQTGGLDVAYQTLDPDQIRSLKETADQGDWQVLEAGGTAIAYMTLNQNQEPLDQLPVRQAIASMVDRQLLDERVFQGQSEALYSMMPTSFDIYEPVFKEKYGDGNYDRARQLLTEAGFSESNPLVLELWYPSASTIRNLVATTLKAAIEQNLPGLVTVTVNNVEGTTAFENLDKGLYQTFLLNWYPDFYDPDTYFQPFMDCQQGSAASGCELGGSQSNGSFYYSDRANELIAQQRAEQDPEARKAIFKQLQELLVEDVPYIPLWQEKDYIFAQGYMEGVEIQPTQQFLFWKMQKS
jgi:peptide/nickel transport system substrate-binding protein